jgi:hypothetical protein
LVIAHAQSLPFRNGCFDEVFSSHVIEHVKSPLNMLQELLRVSNRSIIVKCPHRKGSGAKRPFHLNYLDEEWFNTSITKLGYNPNTHVTNFECLLTSRLLLHSRIHCPKRLLPYVESSVIYIVIRKVERSSRRLRFPFEIETRITK